MLNPSKWKLWTHFKANSICLVGIDRNFKHSNFFYTTFKHKPPNYRFKKKKKPAHSSTNSIVNIKRERETNRQRQRMGEDKQSRETEADFCLRSDGVFRSVMTCFALIWPLRLFGRVTSRVNQSEVSIPAKTWSTVNKIFDYSDRQIPFCWL